MTGSLKKVSFHTLGCKLNFSETSTIAREFEAGGFVRASRGETADICIVNTCSVTEHADKKCRNAVRKLIRENPGTIVAVTGCYAQLKPEELAAIEGVDLVVGNNDKGAIFEHITTLAAQNLAARRLPIAPPATSAPNLASPHTSHSPAAGAPAPPHNPAAIHTCEAHELTGFFASFSSGDRTRSFLKVQDGCDYRCSYCTIPMARGASRNIPIENIITEAKQIASMGQREIVLTGINTGDFGRTTKEKFIDLLRELDRIEGIDRYRISSIEPNLLTDEIIHLTAASRKFQPHFHIPLQSGSDRILALMRRRYTTAAFAERIEAARKTIPDLFIGIDVITGFPGETDEDFDATYRFLESIKPAFLHVFPYSVRPGTPAAEMPNKVQPQIAAQRVKRLTELSEKLHNDFQKQHQGTESTVLWESTRRGGDMFGYTENYIKVAVPFDRSLINTLTKVRLGRFIPGETMRAEII